MKEDHDLPREQLLKRLQDLQQQVDTLTVTADRLSLLMENSSDFIMIADGDGRPVLFNRAYADIMKTVLGIDMKPGIQPHKLMDDPEAVAYWDNIHERVLGGERFSEKFSIEVPGSGKRHFIFSFFPIMENGNVVGFSEISKDVTRWRGAEEALRQSETRFRAAIESFPFEFFMLDQDGRYAIQNFMCRQLRGEIVGKTPAQVAPDKQCLAIWEENNRRAFAGETIKEDIRLHHDGREMWLHNIIAPVLEDDEVRGILGINIDITDRKRIEEELLRAQRLESLGVLAGGIAHDFNNLLSGVFGFIDLARESMEEDHPSRTCLENAMDAYSLARGLTNQLLTFSRGGAPVKRTVPLQPLLRNATQLALSGSRVSSRFELADDLSPVDVDAGQISQVINNIVINARQAMPEGGTVTIRAHNRVVGRKTVANLDAGAYVEVIVADDGPGIPGGTLNRIFDPFFTTKQQGSGLGLATSYSIVNRHGGHITVSSVLGKGTVFTVLLPAAPRSDTSEKIPATKAWTAPARILLMDDEPIVCRAGMMMLESLGCEVVIAADGAEAVEHYARARKEKKPFDAVILDLTVSGGMGGQQAVAELRKIDPSVRAIVSSGYADSPLLANFQDHGFCGILTKPYCLQDIAETLALVLGQAEEKPTGNVLNDPDA